ncbi:MAG: sigma-70 family RNA polymerase sigma factor [Mogibacterium sp.]|nr:sigma-70 family RNA polymerase sigma factor [Mogibacterium sp.]
MNDNTVMFPAGKPDFKTIYDKYYDRIYKYVYTMLLHREDAEDIVSETFIAAYTAYDKYDPSLSSPATWLTRIAHNRAVNYVRSAAYTKRADMPEYYEPSSGPNDFTADIENNELVLRLYSQLSEDEREFLNLRYTMQLKDSEIAEMLGLKSKAVNKRYQRLMAKCRSILENGA